MAKPYYADDQVTLYHGDCREIDEWESAHLLLGGQTSTYIGERSACRWVSDWTPEVAP